MDWFKTNLLPLLLFLFFILIFSVTADEWHRYYTTSESLNYASDEIRNPYTLKSILSSSAEAIDVAHEYKSLFVMMFLLAFIFITQIKLRLYRAKEALIRALSSSSRNLVSGAANEIASLANQRFGKDPNNFLNSAHPSELEGVAHGAVARIYGDHCSAQDSFYRYINSRFESYFRPDIGHYSNVKKSINIHLTEDPSCLQWNESTSMGIHCRKHISENGTCSEFVYPLSLEFDFSDKERLEETSNLILSIGKTPEHARSQQSILFNLRDEFNNSEVVSIDDSLNKIRVYTLIKIPLKEERVFIHVEENSPLDLGDDYFIYFIEHPFHDLDFSITIPQEFYFNDFHFNPGEENKTIQKNEHGRSTIHRSHRGWGSNKMVSFVSWKQRSGIKRPL